MINARKINDELNTFNGIFSNALFLIVWWAILVVQVLITQFSFRVFKCNKDGLDIVQWAMVLALSVVTLVLDTIFKFLPDTICPEFGSKQKKMDGDSDSILRMRKDRDKSASFSNRHSG